MILKGMWLKSIGINRFAGSDFHGFIFRGKEKESFQYENNLFIGMLVHRNLPTRFQNEVPEGKIVVILIPTRFGIHDPSNPAPCHGDLFAMTGYLFYFDLGNFMDLTDNHIFLLNSVKSVEKSFQDLLFIISSKK